MTGRINIYLMINDIFLQLSIRMGLPRRTLFIVDSTATRGQKAHFGNSKRIQSNWHLDNGVSLHDLGCG